MNILSDDQILAKHSPSERNRTRTELAIVNRLIEEADNMGFLLEVWIPDEHREYGGGDYGDSEPYDVKTALFSLDTAQVFVVDENNESPGWVYLVFGNGQDLISDYSLGLEGFLRPILDFVETL